MPLPVNHSELISAMRGTLNEIMQLIEAQKRSLQSHLDNNPAMTGKTIYDLVDNSGQNPMADLLIAKANLLAGIANLQAGVGARR